MALGTIQLIRSPNCRDSEPYQTLVMEKETCILGYERSFFGRNLFPVSHALDYSSTTSVLQVRCIATEARTMQSPNEKKAYRWRKMMRDVEESTTPVDELKKQIRTARLPRETIIGTMTRFKQMRSWNVLVEVLEWLMKEDWYAFNPKDYYLLMLSYCKDGQIENAESLLAKMKSNGIFLGIETYTLLIEAYGRKRSYNKMESVFQSLLSKGPAPTAITYQTLMKAYSEGGKPADVERIFKIVAEADESLMRPDAMMYNLMIYTYGKAGESDKALRLYRQMSHLGLEPSTVTYNTLIALQKTPKDAELMFQKMHNANVKPDVFTYTALINAYAKAKKKEVAHTMFQSMVLAGIRPTHAAYNALLDAYARSKDVDGAEKLLKKMKLDRCRPRVDTYSILVTAYVNASQLEGAEKVLSRMRNAGVIPNVTTYSILINAYANTQNIEKMLKIYEEMRVSAIEPNQIVFTEIINAYGLKHDFDTAFIWFKNMLSSGITPDERSRTTLLHCARNTEQKNEVQELLGSLSLHTSSS